MFSLAVLIGRGLDHTLLGKRSTSFNYFIFIQFLGNMILSQQTEDFLFYQGSEMLPFFLCKNGVPFLSIYVESGLTFALPADIVTVELQLFSWEAFL